MNLSVTMRSDKLLSDIRTSIVTYITTPRYIYFYGSVVPEYLCRIPFDDVVSDASTGDVAIYKFLAVDGPILRNIVEVSGIVTSFKIHGKVNELDSVDESFITGTVGSLTSSSNLRFNKINWFAGTNITLTDLYLIMK